MKEVRDISNSVRPHKTRTGPSFSQFQRVHERGDKVVVNGAKQSLLSILRKFVCQCGKHTLEKLTTKFLMINKVAASYDIVVWMLVFVRLNCEPSLYSLIVREYLAKMQKKKEEGETHQSQKYIDSKKKTLQKFIESAKEFDADKINEDALEQSVGALYSKGKSKDNAFNKLRAYLNKINFENCLDFQESGCSFKSVNQSQSKKKIPIQESEKLSEPNTQSLRVCEEMDASQQGEPNILGLCPLSDEDTEVMSRKRTENQPFKSQRAIQNRESHDLFDKLIYDESSSSFLTDYRIFNEYTSFPL